MSALLGRRDLVSDDPSRAREQFTAGQIALWLVAITCLLGQPIVEAFDLAPARMASFKFSPLFVAMCCIGLVRSRWLFKPAEQLLSPEAYAALKRHSVRRAYRTCFWVALGYSGGALVASGRVQAAALVLIGLALIVVVGSAVDLWTSRRGARLPV
jgi:hypothetical protein